MKQKLLKKWFFNWSILGLFLYSLMEWSDAQKKTEAQNAEIKKFG